MSETNNAQQNPRQHQVHQFPIDDSTLCQFFNRYRNKPPSSSNTVRDFTQDHINRFVSDCIASDSPGYLISTGISGDTILCATALSRAYFDKINGYIDSLSLSITGCHVELFSSVCKELNLSKHRFISPGIRNEHGVADAEFFNRLIGGIREKGRTPRFRQRVAKNKYRAYCRFKSLATYVDALFDHVRSRLIVIRLDLEYHHESAEVMEVGQAQEDLKHFFDNMRNKPSLFDDLVGYIWKLECGELGHDHFHVLLFFTNDRLKNDYHRAKQIGEYWVNVITKGRGRYFNCNDPKYLQNFAQREQLAIGRIEYYDYKKRLNLLSVLAYFCKDTQIVRDKPTQKSRTYGRGEMPPKREVRTGRPRSDKRTF